MNALIEDLLLNEAWKFQGVTLPNPAVGALVLGSYGEILSIAAHKKAGMPHAEVYALQKAFSVLTGNKEILSLEKSHDIHTYLLNNHQGVFEKCSLWVSLEPCKHVGKTPSCASLISVLKPYKVMIGMADPSSQGGGGAEILKAQGIQVEFLPNQSAYKRLLFPFLRLQNHGRFIFFKFAQRLDGSIDKGVISSLSARILTHHFRGTVDLLVISGETVRFDHPYLDTRLASHLTPPDVLIITRKQESISQDIPLFKVPHRKVHFASDPSILCHLQDIGDYCNVMIEGGERFLKSVEPYLDMVAVFVAPIFNASAKVRMIMQDHWQLWHNQTLKAMNAQDQDNVLLWFGKD